MNRMLGLWAAAGVLLGFLAVGRSPAGAEGVPVLPEKCYLFTSFRGNGEDGLHLAWSTDGLKWTALNGDRSYLRPEVGKEKLIRDPCLLQGPDGTFYMVWTDSWTDRTIGYAHSRDLIHWSPQKALPVMQHEPMARNCWAPEIVYDAKKHQFLIFWATTIPGRFPATENSAEDNYNHRIYCTTTKDFEAFTPTRLFYDGGFNVIDATLLRTGKQYYLFLKDETLKPVTRKHLRIARSPQLEGPYTELSEPFTPSWVEGPTALKVGSDYFVYYDEYRKHAYGAVRSKDLKSWEDVSSQLFLPRGTRHGTALPVSRNVLRHLLSATPERGR